MSITPEQAEQSVAIFSKMTGLLGIEATAKAASDETKTRIQVQSEDAGRLIGRKGQHLEGFELLLNRILHRKFGRIDWVELDIDGYQRRNPTGPDGSSRSRVDEEKLTRIAVDAAKEAKLWGESRHVGPFNSAERRVIHMALRDNPDIETQSEEADSDGRKRVLIGFIGEEE